MLSNRIGGRECLDGECDYSFHLYLNSYSQNKCSEVKKPDVRSLED